VPKIVYFCENRMKMLGDELSVEFADFMGMCTMIHGDWCWSPLVLRHICLPMVFLEYWLYL
jgi:hypothetical protein